MCKSYIKGSQIIRFSIARFISALVVCPARSMTVDRTTPVTESDKNLHLQCAVQVKTKNFLRLSWMAGSSLSLIYEYSVSTKTPEDGFI